MDRTIITVVIGGNAYKLSLGNADAIKAMPTADRQQLISLLEDVKRQEAASNAAVNRAVTSQVSAASPSLSGTDRLGTGDVDALMARLAMEEKNSRKSGISKSTVYKILAGFFILTLLAMLL